MSIYAEGDVEGGIVSFGPAAAFADGIEPAGRIVARLARDAAQAAEAFRLVLAQP